MVAVPIVKPQPNKLLYSGLVLLIALAASALLTGVNYLNYNALSPRFESTGDTVWGLVQRLYLIIPLAVISFLRPRVVGFQMGRILRCLPMLAVMLVANVAVIGAYRLISGATPYSGLSMLFNEVITVPLVEEVMWRGVVFALLAAALRRVHPAGQADLLAAWFSGICFGLMHANNALFGYPLGFVALQTLNATVWGVVYGIARAKTGSLYPSILMHAAMNLVAVLV